MVLDLITAAFFAVSVICGIKKGFVKSLKGIVTWAATLIITLIALTPTVNFLMGTNMAQNISRTAYETVNQKANISEAVNQSTVMNERTIIPKSVIDTAGITEAVTDKADGAMHSIADSITLVIVKIIAVCSLLILTKILMWALFSVLNVAAKLPVIHGANRLLGGIFSFAGAALAAYLICAVISLIANPSIYEYINKTMLVKHLFNNNILLNIFIKL